MVSFPYSIIIIWSDISRILTIMMMLHRSYLADLMAVCYHEDVGTSVDEDLAACLKLPSPATLRILSIETTTTPSEDDDIGTETLLPIELLTIAS